VTEKRRDTVEGLNRRIIDLEAVLQP